MGRFRLGERGLLGLDPTLRIVVGRFYYAQSGCLDSPAQYERLEEGFRERVVPWVARPRHGSGDPMGLEAALERPECMLAVLVGARLTSA